MGFNVRRFRTAADLFSQLGLDGNAVMAQLSGFERPEDLSSLSAGLSQMSGFGAERLRQLLRGGEVAPNRLTPTPRDATPRGYAANPADGFTGAGLPPTVARFLEADPFARQMVERMLGGRIQPNGAGGLRVQAFDSGASPDVGDPSGSNRTASNLLSQYERRGGSYANAMASGLSNVASCSGGGGGSSILGDPALTVEDKVALMLMQIMKQMDKQIEAQANYINSLQQQQSGGKGGGGKGGGSAPSIDVETMKLKRLIDKRSQMFDMLRQIIDKYNETAKNLIQSIAR